MLAENSSSYPMKIKTTGKTGVYLRDVPPQPWPHVSFPFRPGQAVRCTQGHSTMPGTSHFDECCTFALDLATPPNSGAAEICAAMNGVAYVCNKCNECDTTPFAYNSSPCGNGFGNHVRIVDESGLYSLYGHLSKVLVHQGQRVHVGQVIGIEGNSGMAGNRHLHFSVRRAESPDLLSQYEQPGEATPFIMHVRYDDRQTPEEVSSWDIRLSRNSSDGPLIYGAD